MGLFPIGLTLDDFLLFHSVSSKMVLNGASISTTSTEKRRALNLYCTLTLKISPTILKDRIDEKICSFFTHGLLNIWTELQSIFFADLPT